MKKSFLRLSGKYKGYSSKASDTTTPTKAAEEDPFSEEHLDDLFNNKDGQNGSDHGEDQGNASKEHDDIEFKKGDYQLKVHIIECLELLPLTGAGIVDPIVFVEILGHKLHTKQKKKCNSCIFDECFTIPLPHMNQSMIEDGTIAISVLDCSSSLSSLMSNNTIGTFNTDLETVYQSPGHEAYRQWIPLFSANRPGITGKMMITLELLGPGDKPIVHDRKAEIIEEKKNRKRAGAEISPSLTLVAQFPQKLSFLVVEIFRAEGIPVLDKSMFGGKMVNHIAAHVAVEFDRHERVHTERAKLTRSHYNDVDYLTALWLPFMEPSFSNRIQLRLMEHHSVSGDEVMSSAYSASLQLKTVKLASEGKLSHREGNAPDPTQLFWVNLYGAPVPEQSSGGEAKKVQMNLYPDSASAYRGRLLVRLRIDENKPNAKGKKRGPEVLILPITPAYLQAQGGHEGGKGESSESSDGSWSNVSPLSSQKSNPKSPSSSPTPQTKHHHTFSGSFHLGGSPAQGTVISVTSSPPPPVLHHPAEHSDKAVVRASMNPLVSTAPTHLLGLPMPKTGRFVLKALVFAGQAFPQGSFMKSKRFSVELRLMHRRLITPEARMEDGYVMWNEAVLLQDTFELPEDPAMMPDLFLYVLDKELQPLCYKKFPLMDLLARPESKQFNTPADWVILKIDKTFSATPHDIFPGAVLLKLGFGREEVAKQNVWATRIKTTCAAFQVNIHIYQGRGLPPSDSNGLLDPYMLVRLGSHKIKTKIHKKTRDPQFMETLSFHMKLPLDDDLKPQLFLELWDQDLAGDDFVGLLKLDLALADKRTISTDKRTMRLKEPEWYALRSKLGADLMGQILLGYELLSVDPSHSVSSYVTSDPKLVPSPDLHPPCSPWKLDMTVLGLRDLEPSGMLPCSKPYMAVLFHGAELRKMPPSKRPTPTDPNFLCRFEETLMLPDNVLFAPTLGISAKDRKIRGMSGAILGSCSIPLDNKILQQRLHLADDADSATELVNIPQRRMRFRSGNPYLSQEDLISSQIVLNDSISTKADDQCRWEDGPDAASNLSDAEQRAAMDAMIATSLETLQGANKDDLPEYLQCRLSLPAELEQVMLVPPFERYPLTVGSVASTVENAMDTAFCQVGVLKCIVNITPQDSSASTTNTAGTAHKVNKGQLAPIKLVEEDVKIRLYVLQGNNLTGQDHDNLSDPYLEVRLGNKKVSTRERHKSNTRDPRFFEVFEFSSKLPGINDIKIKVKDHNDLLADSMIGATVIDLEDRWFCSEWKDLCTKGAASTTLTTTTATTATTTTGSSTSTDIIPLETAKLEPRAPLERRSLYNPKSTAPQGTLTMWLDILSVEDAKKYPVKNITPPPAEDWELRVIVWSATDVPCGDPFEGMNDLYIKCSLGGDSYQATDTHLRLQTGQKGSFNWRMKFPVSLPVSEYAEGAARFFVQAWDMDFITSSDCLGSTQIDLGDTFDKALRRRNRLLKAGKNTNFVHQHFYDANQSKQPRKSSNNGAAARRAAAPTTYWGKLVAYLQGCCSSSGGSEGEGEGDKKGVCSRINCASCSCSFSWCKCCSCCGWGGTNNNKGSLKDSEGSNIDDADLEAGLTERTPLMAPAGKKAYTSLTNETDDGLIRDRAASTDSQDQDQEQNQDDLLDLEAGNKDNNNNEPEEPVTRFKRKRKRKKRPLSMYDSARMALGIVPAKIEHAQEVQLFTSDQQPAGKVLMSISLVHKDVAMLLKAGEGRSEPNMNPTLPDPEGRIDFTKMWNPFYMCRVCAGDKIFAELACVFSCLAFFLVYYFIGQPILTLFMVLKEFFGMWMVYLILLTLIVGGCVLYYYLKAQVRRVCCGKNGPDDTDSDDEEG